MEKYNARAALEFLMNETVSLSPYSEVTDALIENGIKIPVVCVYKNGELCDEK